MSLSKSNNSDESSLQVLFNMMCAYKIDICNLNLEIDIDLYLFYVKPGSGINHFMTTVCNLNSWLNTNKKWKSTQGFPVSNSTFISNWLISPYSKPSLSRFSFQILKSLKIFTQWNAFEIRYLHKARNCISQLTHIILPKNILMLQYCFIMPWFCFATYYCVIMMFENFHLPYCMSIYIVIILCICYLFSLQI